MALGELPAAKLRMFLHPARGVARRKMIVVKDPHLHSELFRLGNDQIHVVPPRLSAEIPVRTRFHAESAAAAVINTLYLLRYFIVMVAVLPVERQHIVVLQTA